MIIWNKNKTGFVDSNNILCFYIDERFNIYASSSNVKFELATFSSVEKAQKVLKEIADGIIAGHTSYQIEQD